ncbi:NAD(P)-binding domain-containing protein [Sphingobacterium siyangense]|uniref:NADPH-dependent F420 reductase n=1 Tax=Bacteroidota TaxID=976 RepID=UPI0020109E53|nr:MULTISPECIES: NAD(P)-binding domain-containing protein [Bacteroidota]MDX4973885.1 NAD(P)-binding domain-containing protein [Myroides odoratimimus]UQA73300.1 NAD(P)-binding domain-containing protein [Sphingobacterium siyangense]
MNIGIIGVGLIGKTLALKLSEGGHNVDVANSSGPENIAKDILANGAQAVSIQQAIDNKDVIIISIPLSRIPAIAPLFSAVSEATTIIDTSNYYPARDGSIDSIESGQVESLWVKQQLGRPFAKAWNAIGAHSFAVNGKPSGAPQRIAIPISADRDIDRQVAIKLIDETGFDAFDAGALSDSWRQQPGSPVYCTDLTQKEIASLMDTAEKERLPKRRDLAILAITERLGGISKDLDPAYLLRINRALYI